METNGPRLSDCRKEWFQVPRNWRQSTKVGLRRNTKYLTTKHVLGFRVKSSTNYLVNLRRNTKYLFGWAEKEHREYICELNIWWNICKLTMIKTSQMPQCDFKSSRTQFWGHIWNPILGENLWNVTNNVKMHLQIFEETSENWHGRKISQIRQCDFNSSGADNLRTHLKKKNMAVENQLQRKHESLLLISLQNWRSWEET